MRLEQMTEAAHRGLVRRRLATEIDPDKTPHRQRIVKRLLHRRVRQIEPLLQEIDAQHPLDPDRRAAIARLWIKWLDQHAQRRPRHNPLHLSQKRYPPRRLGVALKPHCRQRQLLHPPTLRSNPPRQALYHDHCSCLLQRFLSTNPVLGDMLTETTYADYKDFGGVQFPTKITQKAGGFPTLDLAVSEVKPNATVDIQVPDNVRQAVVKVQTDKIADGVWYLTGGTHHSVLVEMADHLVVIDGPQDDARSTALIAEVKKIVPDKPIKFVVNTHHHFDHAV